MHRQLPITIACLPFVKMCKGSINTDFSRSRKNICVSLLYPFLSSKEVDWIKSNKIEIQNDLIIKYFKKYQIYESIMNELNNTYVLEGSACRQHKCDVATAEREKKWKKETKQDRKRKYSVW